MSIDKSLKRKRGLARQRSVLTREERIKVLQDEERWQDGRSPFNLPKVRVVKIVIKKAKKAKAEGEGEAGAAAGAAPAAGAAASAAGKAPAAGAKAPAAAKAPAGKEAAKKK
jgi:small basic protein (TIGR04137 family)